MKSKGLTTSYVLCLIQAPMNLSHVVTIGTFRGGSVGGLEEGKGVQPILGRKNPTAKSRLSESCRQKYV